MRAERTHPQPQPQYSLNIPVTPNLPIAPRADGPKRYKDTVYKLGWIALIAMASLKTAALAWKLRTPLTDGCISTECFRYTGMHRNGLMDGVGRVELTNSTPKCIDSFKNTFLEGRDLNIRSVGDYLSGHFNDGSFTDGYRGLVHNNTLSSVEFIQV